MPRRPPLLLELDLTADLLEEAPQDLLGRALARRRTPLHRAVTRLHEAAADPRVGGLVAKVAATGMPLARVQELADAVAAFRRTGRPCVAWAETFGEFAPGTSAYLLATAFEQVWLQPSGDLCLTGVAAEVLFARAALDRLGIEPQLDRRHEYKNAADLMLSTRLSEPHREALQRVVDSAFEQVVEQVAYARGLPTERVRELVDAAPLPAAAAADAGLVDRLGYRDQVYADLRGRLGGRVTLRYLSRYSRPPRPTELVRRVGPRSGHVAVVHVTGGIRLGHGGRTPTGGPVAGSDGVAGALRAALRDEHTRAVVLRVSSPGGSYVASDVIWRAVAAAREAGRPVVASMAEVAASGGYFVSCGADAIVAQPATLTGSIGVFGGKPVLTELLERYGLHPDGVGRGAHARMFSPRRRFDDGEWQALQDWLDRVYDDFVARVAAGRGLSRERVHELARGRVWTGADARERGLLDGFGGLRAAVELARERAGLDPRAPARGYPQVSLLRQARPQRSSDDLAAPPTLPLAGRLFAAQLGRDVLRMPALRLG